MAPSTRFVISVVSIIGVLAALLAWGPLRLERRPDYSKASRRLQAEIAVRLSEIATAHRADNPIAHLRATANTLRLTNRASIRALLPEVDQLVAAIRRDGLAPYASVAIDVGYRLARVDHPKTAAKFMALARVVHARADRSALMAEAKRMPALIRRHGSVTYRQHDEPVSVAVARIAFTDYGLRQMRHGQTPSDLTRTVAMAWECQPDEKREQARSAGARERCRRFLDVVVGELSKSAQAGILQAALTDVNGGIRSHTFECLSGERHGLEMVEAVEAYTACIVSKAKPPTEYQIDGSSLSAEWLGPPPSQPGWTHTGSTETIRHGPNGNYGRQVDHHYTNAAGGTRTVTDYQMRINGKEDRGTYVVTHDGQGNMTQDRYDEDGELTFSVTDYGEGGTSTYQKNADGSSTTVTTDKNNVTTIVQTDKDGNKKEATIGPDGKCTGQLCDEKPPPPPPPPDPETPVGEMDNTPACTLSLGDSLARDPDLTADPLGPYIYPTPDTAVADPQMMCLFASMSPTAPERCPPSVALCVEPPPPGSCKCGTPQLNTVEANLAARCHVTMCAEGDSCDPLTGVCRSPASTGEGGISPPIPTARKRVPR
ncbi:MAG: hypothetical protein WBC51_07585 [Vicinamibacterales bacterium]